MQVSFVTKNNFHDELILRLMTEKNFKFKKVKGHLHDEPFDFHQCTIITLNIVCPMDALGIIPNTVNSANVTKCLIIYSPEQGLFDWVPLLTEQQEVMQLIMRTPCNVQGFVHILHTYPNASHIQGQMLPDNLSKDQFDVLLKNLVRHANDIKENDPDRPIMYCDMPSTVDNTNLFDMWETYNFNRTNSCIAYFPCDIGTFSYKI